MIKLWKPYLDKWEVSDSGDCRLLADKKLKNPFNHKGYLRYNVGSKKHYAHRMVMLAFCPHPDADELTVNHKDGNKQNNSLDNLEWCTIAENNKHARRLGLWRGPGKAGHNLKDLKAENDDLKKALGDLEARVLTLERIVTGVTTTYPTPLVTL